VRSDRQEFAGGLPSASGEISPWPSQSHAARQLAEDYSAALLEQENLGLRRLVVELLEKNQRLREALQLGKTLA
jgi:hypothetical protein